MMIDGVEYNPLAAAMTKKELDAVCECNHTRKYHTVTKTSCFHVAGMVGGLILCSCKEFTKKIEEEKEHEN